MAKNERIVRYTDEEVRAMIALAARARAIGRKPAP
jgi:hypothetical protein